MRENINITIDTTNRRMIKMSKIISTYGQASSILKKVRKASNVYHDVVKSSNYKNIKNSQNTFKPKSKKVM